VNERLRAAFLRQGKACAMLGSPFMGRLMPLLADRVRPDNAVARRLLDWPGDVSANGHSVPLRLAGALHGLVLEDSDAALAAVNPPAEVGDEALWAAVEAAMLRHEARLMAWLDQAPQTNEVRRAAALIPAIWWALARHDLPVTLSELGASAGLNLSLDRFALRVGDGLHGPADSPVQLAPDWSGAGPAPRPIRVAERAGVDRNPLDPSDPAAQLRLLAYLWPDQPHRLTLTRGAIALADTVPERDDAAPWLARRLANPRPGTLHVVYNTIAWQYFPPETQAAATAALEDAGRRATADAPLAHVAMEADGDAEGAALILRLWPDPEGGGTPHLLARVDFHGRWIAWRL
jgi:PTH1 family peptidyl-tRNA hydrolase